MMPPFVPGKSDGHCDGGGPTESTTAGSAFTFPLVVTRNRHTPIAFRANLMEYAEPTFVTSTECRPVIPAPNCSHSRPIIGQPIHISPVSRIFSGNAFHARLSAHAALLTNVSTKRKLCSKAMTFWRFSFVTGSFMLAWI